jgi:hypothetical protein
MLMRMGVKSGGEDGGAEEGGGGERYVLAVSMASSEAIRSGRTRAAVGVRWAVGVSNTDEVDKLNDQDDTARYRNCNWTDGVGMASWGGASRRRETRSHGCW